MNANNVKLLFFLFSSLSLLSGCVNDTGTKGEGGGIEPPICPDCNVILIVIDTLRADHVGCYGYFRNTTPHIDGVAEDGIIFKNAHSQSSHTTASHTSIFTSTYPAKHKFIFPQEDIKINDGIKTLAETLAIYNYTTAYSAALKDSAMPIDRGFERGFNYLIDQESSIFCWGNPLKWINENSEKKFFMFLHTSIVHEPNTPKNYTLLSFTDEIRHDVPLSLRELWDEIFSRIYTNPSLVFKEETIKRNSEFFSNTNTTKEEKFEGINRLAQDYKNIHRSPHQMLYQTYLNRFNLTDDDDLEYLNLLYDGSILEADYLIHNLTENLDKNNILNKTLLIITADHGQEIMEHGKFGHGTTLYMESIHVPLIIKSPDSKIKNTRIEQAVQSIDILPTILDFLNITPLSQAQGLSLFPFFYDYSFVLPERQIYSETFGNKISIIDGKWKLISAYDFKENGSLYFDDHETELYDLSEDPSEKNNLWKENPEVTHMLKNKIERHVMENMKEPYTPAFPEWLENETKEKIMKEGYW